MKKIVSLLLALIMLSSAALFTSCGNEKKDEGKSGTAGMPEMKDYSILIPADADECTKNSAEILKKYIANSFDVAPEIVTERPSGAVIEYVKDAEDAYSLGKEGYRVKVEENGDVVLTCGALRGSLYATYYVLEQFFGYRFLTGDVEYLYEKGRFDIVPGFEETETPGFEYRALNQIGATENDFAALRLNGVDAEGSRAAADPKYGGGEGNLYLHGHSYAYQEAVGMKLDEAGITDLDSEEAMKIFQTYGYNTEERDALDLDSKQPCLTSEDTFRHIMAFNYLLYKERTERGEKFGVDYTMFSCSPNDNTAFCTCDNCKAVYNEEGSISGAVFRLSNRVSDAMKEIDPDIGIFTIAYWDARTPPKNTRPNDDVCVAFCIGGCNNHTYDRVEECEAAGGNDRYPFLVWSTEYSKAVKSASPISNVFDMEYYERWAELTNNLFMWYYATNFIYYIAPAPNVFNIYNDFRYAAEKGTRGVYCEGSSRGYTFENLRGYLACRMMWDPAMKEEEFEAYLDEYLMIYYGAGWENIREYLDIQNKAGDLKGCWMNNFDWPWDMYDKEYYAENFDHIVELFDAALAATDDPVQKARIEEASIHAYFLGLSATYERDYVTDEEGPNVRYAERYAYLWNYLNENGYVEGEREDGYKCTSFQNGKAGLDEFPSSPDDVKDPMTWIFDDFTGSRED